MSAAELAALLATSTQAGDVPQPVTRDEIRRVMGWGLIQQQSADCAR